jgi:hypothetical protein
VATNHDVTAIGRRRREAAFQFFGARLNAFLQTGRQSAAANELLFETRRKLIAFGEPWRKMGLIFGIPAANGITVVVFVVSVVLVVLVFVFIVAFAVPVAVVLGHSEISSSEKSAKNSDAYPLGRIHMASVRLVEVSSLIRKRWGNDQAEGQWCRDSDMTLSTVVLAE